MLPILTRCCGYILQLEDDCYYVGITLNLNTRLSQHFDQIGGANWTSMHKPIRLLHVEYDVDTDWENMTTLTLMSVHGIDKVRGGAWCKEHVYRNPLDYDTDIDNLEECIIAEELFALFATLDWIDSELDLLESESEPELD
jgi:hypothetical protein